MFVDDANEFADQQHVSQSKGKKSKSKTNAESSACLCPQVGKNLIASLIRAKYWDYVNTLKLISAAISFTQQLNAHIRSENIAFPHLETLLSLAQFFQLLLFLFDFVLGFPLI